MHIGCVFTKGPIRQIVAQTLLPHFGGFITRFAIDNALFSAIVFALTHHEWEKLRIRFAGLAFRLRHCLGLETDGSGAVIIFAGAWEIGLHALSEKSPYHASA